MWLALGSSPPSPRPGARLCSALCHVTRSAGDCRTNVSTHLARPVSISTALWPSRARRLAAGVYLPSTSNCIPPLYPAPAAADRQPQLSQELLIDNDFPEARVSEKHECLPKSKPQMSGPILHS